MGERKGFEFVVLKFIFPLQKSHIIYILNKLDKKGRM